jgi:hypothetical protein
MCVVVVWDATMHLGGGPISLVIHVKDDMKLSGGGCKAIRALSRGIRKGMVHPDTQVEL